LGCINYYGLQRFGNCKSIPTHEVGLAILKQDFKGAVEMILKERDGEHPSMKKVRENWKNNQDAREALRLMDRRQSTSVEAKVLSALAKSGENKNYNYLQALQYLPRNMQMLYTHAYQSFVFNQMASKRREMGLQVIEGDLVFKELMADNREVIIEEENIESNENEEETEVKEEVESKFKDMVRALTKEDVEGGKYSIFDILLPLPGHDITFPKGAMGEFYEECLLKNDLSPEKLKSKHKYEK
jgi:tRNA pseudouridine13 synthase